MEQLSLNELKELCKERSLSTTGNKDNIIKKLNDYNSKHKDLNNNKSDDNSTMNNILQNVNKFMDSFQSLYNSKIEELNVKIQQLQNDNSVLKAENEKIKKEVISLNESFAKIEYANDSNLQNTFKDTLFIHIKNESDNDNLITSENLPNNLVKACSDQENPIDVNAITKIKIIKPKYNNDNNIKNNNKLFQISIDNNNKYKLFKKKKILRNNNILIFNKMTRIRQQVWQAATNLKKINKIYSFWFKNGDIFYKSSELSNPKKVDSLLTLTSIK